MNGNGAIASSRWCKYAKATLPNNPAANQIQTEITMKKSIQATRIQNAFCASALLAVVPAYAEGFEREGKWALAPLGIYLTSDDASVDASGISASVSLDSAYGGGVAFGFDLSNYLTLGVDLWGGVGDFKGTAPGLERTYSASLFGMNTFLDYNILKSRFTPLLSANLGFLTMSADVDNVSAGETDFLFGVGGGVRWDISDNWFAKAVYRLNWMEFEGVDELTMVHGVLVQVGYRF